MPLVHKNNDDCFRGRADIIYVHINISLAKTRREDEGERSHLAEKAVKSARKQEGSRA
jgi:hypothetical protein